MFRALQRCILINLVLQDIVCQGTRLVFLKFLYFRKQNGAPVFSECAWRHILLKAGYTLQVNLSERSSFPRLRIQTRAGIVKSLQTVRGVFARYSKTLSLI